METKAFFLALSLLLLGLSHNSHADKPDFNFKHIKLGEVLKKRADIIRNADDFNEIQLKARSAKISEGPSSRAFLRALRENDKVLAKKINLEIDEQDKRSKTIESLSLKTGVNKEFIDSNTAALIYKGILAFLGTRYDWIGRDESQAIIDYSQDFDLGESNFSGFSWQKPFGSFSVFVDRRVVPDYKNSGKWIVQDTFSFSIDAQTLLQRLVDSGMASLEGIGVEAFAGLEYKRKYTVHHFADSYNKGLTSDFSKLFLPFLQFSRKKLLAMSPYQQLKKEDFLSVSAGASVETPPLYGFELKGGVMVKTNRATSVSAQAIGPRDNPVAEEFLRVSVNKEFELETTVSADLQLDFFKILKLTLLSFELEYSFSSNDQINLSFNNSDRAVLSNTNEQSKELDKLIRLSKLKVDHLEKNVISLEQKKERDLNSEYSALIWGKLKKSQSQVIKIINGGTVKEFLRESYENVSVEKSILSKLWAAFVYKILAIESRVKDVIYKAKRFTIEYDATRAQDQKVEPSEEFSVKLSNEVVVNKSKGKLRKRYRKLMASSLRALTNIDPRVADKVEKQELKSPMKLDQEIVIQKDGFKYFNAKTPNQIFGDFAHVCKSKRKRQWQDPKKRAKYLKRLQFGKELCVKKLGKWYNKYYAQLIERKKIDLVLLRKILSQYLKKSSQLVHITNLFGSNNLFIHGKFNAKTKDGAYYETYFNSGVFKGLGLIENYRNTSSMVPIKYE